MSWELCACLERFGLEERWLKILKNLEIETIKTLEARGKDIDLYNVLEKAATDEEKKALPLLFAECKDLIKQMKTFASHLKKNGLKPAIWQKAFAEEGILTLQDLHKRSGNLEKYDVLSNDASEEETNALRQVMNISSEIAGEHEVGIILGKIGLESKYWLPIFKNELHIVYPALLRYLTAADCRILIAAARNENEVSVIKNHFMTENDQLFAVIWQRDKENLRKYSAEVEKLLLELEKGLTTRQKTVTENGIKKTMTENGIQLKVKEETPDDQLKEKEETSDDQLEEKKETSDDKLEEEEEISYDELEDNEEISDDWLEEKEETSDDQLEEEEETSDDQLEEEETSDDQLEEEETAEEFKIKLAKENLCVLLQIPRMDLAKLSNNPAAAIKILKQEVEEL